MTKHELDTPVAIVDLDIMERNIQKMAEYAKSAGVNLRPHIKTHKIPAIAHKQIEAGAIGITVAKLGEAEVMASAGIRNILIVYPIVGEVKVKRLIDLTRETSVIASVDSAQVAQNLSKAAQKSGISLDVVIIVDLGFESCGISPGMETVKMAKRISKLNNLRFKGIMGYAGQVYKVKNQGEIRKVAHQEASIMVQTAQSIISEGIPVKIVSVGSTPTARILGNFAGVTEIRPGTYVFNDNVEIDMGVAETDDCAVKILSTVISRPTSTRAVIDAGSKILSSDRGLKPIRGFGRVINDPNVEINSLQEEHGTINLKKPSEKPRVGDKIEIIPNHVCAVVNLVDKLIAIRKDKVEIALPVAARGKVT